MGLWEGQVDKMVDCAYVRSRKSLNQREFVLRGVFCYVKQIVLIRSGRVPLGPLFTVWCVWFLTSIRWRYRCLVDP